MAPYVVWILIVNIKVFKFTFASVILHKTSIP
jgi:hypothetical protein